MDVNFEYQTVKALESTMNTIYCMIIISCTHIGFFSNKLFVDGFKQHKALIFKKITTAGQFIYSFFTIIIIFL